MFFNRISLKLGLWYSGAFFLSALTLFGLTTYLLLGSLQAKDRDLLTEKSQEYALLYARDGVNGLRIRASAREIRNAPSFVVRLSDVKGRTLFIHVPDRSGDDDAPRLPEIEEFLTKTSSRHEWFHIPAEDFGDSLEIISTKLPTGEVLQVGKDTEDREAFIQSYTQAYFKGLAPIFLLAIAVGSLLSNRLLKPIRSMTQTVQMIRAGESKARVELHQSNDELRELGHLFNQMLGENERLVEGMRETVDNVAHDLRTPVMRLQNAIEAALRGPEVVEKLRDALVDCRENSELILKLVDGIMDISEAEAGTLKLRRQQVTIAELVDGVVDLYGFVAEEKKIELVISAGERIAIEGDRMRLIQALSNLVDNAIKYSPENTKVTIESRAEGQFGIVSVTDEGIGIPEYELPRIWDRLYRIDASRTSRGLGLGLSLVKAIVSAHGGLVGVEPNPAGKGTKFFMKFRMT